MNPPHSLEEMYVFTGRMVYYFIERMDTELLDKNSKPSTVIATYSV